MIMKSAIAAHVALLKKQAAVMPQATAVEDPNQQALAAAKADASRKKSLADIAVERSNAALATSKAANTIQQNQAQQEEIAAAAQPQTMPGPGGAVGGAPTTPGMPAAPPVAQPMQAAAPQTISPGSWGVQPAQQVGGM